MYKIFRSVKCFHPDSFPQKTERFTGFSSMSKMHMRNVPPFSPSRVGWLQKNVKFLPTSSASALSLPALAFSLSHSWSVLSLEKSKLHTLEMVRKKKNGMNDTLQQRSIIISCVLKFMSIIEAHIHTQAVVALCWFWIWTYLLHCQEPGLSEPVFHCEV